METARCRAVLAAAETGSFSRAAEVLRALEGGLNLVDCLEEEESCGKSCACPSRIVWLKIRDGLNRIVDGITLQDMIDEYACQMAQGEEE